MTAVPHFKLSLLGSFQLSQAGDAPVTPRRKTRALLAYLAATNRPHTRRALMDWFCQDAQSPARALSLLLTRVRQHLGTAVLITQDDTVQLDLRDAWVDYAVFQQQLTGDLTQKNAADLETAVALYRGEFLEGLTLPDAPEFELWLLGQRTQARQLLERGLLALVQQLSRRGDYKTAVSYARQLLQHNPLLEESHAQLIWLYAQTGQRDAALRQYDQCRDLLQSELGVAPTGDLQQLQAAILSGELARPFHRTAAAVLPVSPPLPADFVGRRAEFAQLQAAWQAARTGQGTALLIGAPAGGGKTRLVQELMGQLRQTPPTAVYAGRCYESTRALSYQPWLEILEAHAARLDDAALGQLPPVTQAYVSRLLPDVARRLPSTPALSASLIDEPERLFTAVVDFLAQSPSSDRNPKSVIRNPITDDGLLNTDTPRLLFLDDLQWADETSLRLLHYVSQRIGRFPWLLIGAYRAEEMAEAPALATLLDDFARRDVPHLKLAPLSPADIVELTAHIWPRLAPGYRGHVADMLAQATGGNALFVTAVLQELATSDQIPAELPVPATVQDLWQRRLRRLPPGSRQVLEALAVWSGPATLAQLQHIGARGEAETTQALEWGLQWGLVAVDTAVSPITYQFQHDLVREAVYATLSAVRRQRLHHRSAQWLDRMARRLPDAMRQETVGGQGVAARILYHAQRGEAFDLVFQWAPAAAAHARQTFAYRDAMQAVDAMRHAFSQIQLASDFDPDTAEPLLFEQLIWWLSYSWVLGKSEAAEQAVLQQARSLLARHPSPLRAVQLRFMEAQIALSYEESVPVFQEVHRQFLRLGELAQAAGALAIAANASITMSRNIDGRALYEQALSLYRQADDRAGEIRCLTGLAWTAVNLGQIAVTLDYAQQALAISQEQGDKLGEAQALFSLAAGWTFYCIPDKMADLAAAAQQLYEQVGTERWAIRPYLYLGAAYDMRGDEAEALAVFEEVLAQAVTYQDTWIAGWAAQLAGRVYLRRGQLAAAEEKLMQAQQLRLESGERQNQVSDLAWLGRLAVAQGETAVALEHTQQAMTQLAAFHGEFYVWEQPDVLMCRAEALAANGQTREALAVARQAQAMLHQFAQQIGDPDVLAQFMAYPTNARVATAVTTQHITLNRA